MTVFEKFNWLSDKRCGLGVPMSTLSRYCGCHPSTLRAYVVENEPAKLDTVAKYEAGLNDLIKDFKKYVMEEE